MVLSMTKIADQFVSFASLQLVSAGTTSSGQPAWAPPQDWRRVLLVGGLLGSARRCRRTGLPAAPPPVPSAYPVSGLYAQTEATLRASLMALGLPIDGDKNALVQRLSAACGATRSERHLAACGNAI
eukprot:4924676-Prymnesium_polylepis.1